MQRLKSLYARLPLILLACSLFSVYFSTLAPGLTWANGGSDGGDLIAAAATGGVPHPTGYPLYLLLARLFQFLPVGSLAFRTNLLSAVSTSLAGPLIYEIVMGSSESKLPQHWYAGMVAGYAFGLAPLIWSQAVITEVYGLQSFLIALILYLYLRPVAITSLKQKFLDCLRGLVLGLAMGNHVTTVLLIPAALVLGSVHQIPRTMDSKRLWFQSFKLERGALLRQMAMLGVGLTIYVIIPLRASTHPPINWGNATTPARFWWLMSGQLYQAHYLQFTLPEIWGRIQAVAALLLEQFGFVGIAIGFVGLVVFGVGSRLYLLTVWTAILHTVFAVFYGSVDSYVYLVPMLLCAAIWVGLTLIELSHRLPRRWLCVALGLLSISYIAGRSITFVDQVEAVHDTRAEAYGREVLSAAPEDAIIFAEGDDAVFALWYFHFALRQRPDLAVLATDLLHFDWYQDNIHETYSSLVIPAPFPWPETIIRANPSHAVCYARYSDRTEFNCTHPLISPQRK